MNMTHKYEMYIFRIFVIYIYISYFLAYNTTIYFMLFQIFSKSLFWAYEYPREPYNAG